MDNDQRIDCSVEDCKHCDCDNKICELKSIKVCNCGYGAGKENTMCASYKKR